MADSQTNININIDTSQALANLKALQSQISAFQTSMARGSATQAANAAKLRQNLINDINATKKFAAGIENIKTTTESFTTALEKNKLSMGEYFRYAGGATKSFGKMFKTEMSTIDKVARERVKTLQTQYIQLGRDAQGAMKAIAVRPLVLDMEDLGTKTAIAAQKQQILNQLLKQGSTNLLNWGKNTQWAGRQLMVGFTVPLTMAGSAAAKMYMELEKASIKFKRVYGDFNTTAKDVEDMSKNLQILAQNFTKYGVAVADTMNMAAEAAAAGKTGLDLIEQVSNAARLAVLGQVEQSQALETTMSLTNAFGLAAEDLTGKINFLNAVENQTVTSIEDLTIAIPKAAPVIQQLGGDVEDLAFFLTAMKEGGINASEGANALKSGLASMINPTAKASEFLAGFGINLKGIVDANKGNVKATVIEFGKALDTLDPLNRAQAIEQLFGKFQFARLSTLFQNVTKEGTQAQRVLELSNATTEELAILSERELKKVESSPMFKFQKAVEDIKVKLVPIGEAFLKAITPVIDFVGKFLDGFNKMSDGAKSFWITLTGLVAGIGPLLLMTVGLVGNGVANLIKMFVGIKSFINRTSQETGNLGESTSYMTEAQIKAAAVAASLDQIHQQLTQRFTSEAAAVDALTGAYERNITAQGAYGPVPAAPKVAKKFAEGGIISGPGNGTSDSIVAMVSNGEAVIPAKSVARNPDLVKALIAGDVPKFSVGGIMGGWDVNEPGRRGRASIATTVEKLNAGGVAAEVQEVTGILSDMGATTNTARQLFSNMNTALESGPETFQSWMQSLRDNKDQVTSATQLIKLQKQTTGVAAGGAATNFTHIGSGASITAEEAQRMISDGSLKVDSRVLQGIQNAKPTDMVDIKSALAFGNFDAATNRDLAAKGASKGQFASALAAAGVGTFDESIKYGGGNAKELEVESAAFVQRLQRLVAELDETTTLFDSEQQAIAYRQANPGAQAASVENLYATARMQELAANPNSRLIGALDTAQITPTEARIAGAGTKKRGVIAAAGSVSALNKQAATELGVEDIKPYTEGMKSATTSESDPFKVVQDESKRNSPHKDAFSLGAEDQNEYNKGAQSVPPPKIPGVEAPQFQAPVARTLKDRAMGIVGAVKDKGADLVSRGINAGKVKLAETGQSLVDSWNQSIDNEIAAGKRAHEARFQMSDQLLLATDEEYMALTAQQEIYRQKLLNTNSATAQEQQEALVRNQILEEKRNLLINEMKENGIESEVIQERLRLAEQRGTVIDAEQMNNANQASGPQGGAPAARGGFLGKIGPKLNGFMMTASMVSGGLSMMGGKIGEVAQQITPLLGGFSMLTMMLQQMSLKMGLATLAIAGIALVIAGFMQYKEAIGRGIDSVLEFNDAIGTGAKAIQGLAEFAGKVTASEVLDKRRKEALNPFQVVTGKTTFGENFADSETGEGMMKGLGASTAAFGAGQTRSALTSQLATAVLSNAITPAQARSIAVNIGRKMGNIELGVDVAGQLGSLLGPNGENILKDGLAIRVKLIQESQEQIGMASGNLQKNGGMTGGEVGSTVGGAALGAAGGALAGGIAAAILGGPVGWIVGGAAIAGAIYGAYKGAEKYAERLGKLAGANVAIQANALNQQKQMIDSLQLDYEKRIAAAKAAGDTAKAERLQNQYIRERQGLLDQNAKTMNQIIQSFENSSYKTELQSGAEKAVTKKYKGTAMEEIAGAALSNIQTNVGDATKKYTLTMLLNTTVDPMNMLVLTDLMATDASVIDKTIKIATNLTGTGLNDVLAIADMFRDKNGNLDTGLQADFITKMSLVKGKEADELMGLYRELGRMKDNWLDATILVDFISKDPTKEAAIMEDIEQIKDLPKGELSVDIVQKANILDDKAMEVLRQNEDYFNKIKTREQQQIYLEYVATLTGAINFNDPNFDAWLASERNTKNYKKDLTGWYAFTADLAQRATDIRVGDNAFVEEPKTTGNGGGPSASWLDDYVKGVRDLTDASQKLTVGYAASSKALEAFAKKGSAFKNTFAGLATNLYAAGVSQDIIDNILGMPKEEADKYMKLFFTKNGKITDFVKKLMQISAIAKLRKAEEAGFKATRSIYDQVDATKALTLGNTNSALSAEMLADADMMVALAGVKLIGNQKEQKKQIDMLTKSKLASLAADRLAKGRVQNEIDDAQVRINTLEAENNVYQNGLDIIGKKSEKISETYDKQIEALQEVKSVNDEIAKQKQSELDVADALSRGDIGAAAKAAQQLRAQQTQAAADARIKALEDAKKRALDALTVEINGQRFTRAELEQKIYDISLEVLEIKKEEIVQNELLLAKQAEVLNSLVALTAEQIKKNAEAGKPITQVITRVIKTVSSGSGGGNADGTTTSPETDTTKPTVTSGSAAATDNKSIQTTIDKALSGETAKNKLVTAAKSFYTDYDQLKNFVGGSGQKYGDMTTSTAGTKIKNDKDYLEWKALFDSVNSKRQAIVKMGGGNIYASGTGGFYGSALGAANTSSQNAITSLAGFEAINAQAISGGSIANQTLQEAYKNLPIEAQWIKEKSDPNARDKAWQDFNDWGRGGRYEELKRAMENQKISQSTNLDTSNKALMTRIATGYKNVFNTTEAEAMERVLDGIKRLNVIRDGINVGKKYRKTLKDSGYTSEDLARYFGRSGVLEENLSANPGTPTESRIDLISKMHDKVKYFSVGGFAKGTDVVPAMLTPGEFVVSQAAVKNFGAENLKAVNSGTYEGNSVYNYSVNVNVANSGANANDIARTVIAQIKQIDSQRIRSNVL